RLPVLLLVGQQDLRDDEIDGEWLVGASSDRANLGAERVGEIADASEAPHAARLADRDDQVGLGNACHSGRQHRVFDPEPIGERRPQHRSASLAATERATYWRSHKLLRPPPDRIPRMTALSPHSVARAPSATPSPAAFAIAPPANAPTVAPSPHV